MSSEDLGSERPMGSDSRGGQGSRPGPPPVLPPPGGEPEFGTLSFYVKALGAFILVIACLLIFLKLLGRFGAG
ncbi:MAG: hypothetical protein LBF40_00325, partial [Deltaproteobacteria bacterium]|nr:hypothetical protein [Deltaproteobacteria bacterium]